MAARAQQVFATSNIQANITATAAARVQAHVCGVAGVAVDGRYK